MIKKLIVGVFLGLLLSACNTNQEESKISRLDFPNVLNLKGTIERSSQAGVSSFSDLGTWHSFSLNEDSNLRGVGGFVGPFLMRQQQSFWLSPSIIKLQIKDVDAGELLDLSKAQNVSNTFYPGLLKQTFEINDLLVNLYLFNANKRTSVITADVSNQGNARTIQLGWKGTVFSKIQQSVTTENNRVCVKINNREEAQLLFNCEEITVHDSCYSLLETPEKLEESAKCRISGAFMYLLDKNEVNEYLAEAAPLVKEPEVVLERNEKRWNKYLQQLNQGSEDAVLNVDKYQQLAVKAFLTLIHNWRSEAGDILHQGIVPSYAATYFQGLWAWDSWKHAVAIAPFEPELAKDQIRAIYDYQNEEGMLADCFFRDLSIEGVNWRNTKAPLSGWSIFQVYTETQDLNFIKEMFPKLLKYHEWWYANRDHDQNGLCEYGSTDGTRIAAAWESGMDNAVRFDDAKIIENNRGAYSIDQESVDLNAYLYQEKRYIQKLATVLGKKAVADRFEQEAQQLREKIQVLMYRSEDGFFYDIKLDSHEKIAIQGPEGWSPLYNEVASAEQAKELVKVIMDTTRFNTPMPFPTLSAAHEQFNPQRGYWRGPVWLDQAYFAIEGMKNYGYVAEAKMMAVKLVESAEGLVNSQMPIRENYHPITKEGLNAEHFSWSAAHLLMLF
ncbi:MGH1-like glycoside hydrolase domain-containing protein [Sunxiuqinia elliptica]|uniref:Putative isomerase n=1 Tax=Sunxiuqinia elliptica TaxID=655355 RepID=A0A4R6GSS3_9BACT|nr:trehalase family glycosidase [Sunxiuqinia elliptica]TDN98293.1 putative isomerase [Sunxiuqinia elliptica]TDO60399.1 putative isomerase [Sunxiuqinia elliptica]